MNQLLNVLPKSVLAFLAIVGGILLIVLVQPPHSVCDAQVEVLNTSQQKFLYPDPKSKLVKTTRYQRLREHCFNTSNPGGCFELFQELKALLNDLGSLSSECGGAIAGVSEYKNALWDSADLLLSLAWGSEPPASVASKWRWLEVSDISLFCRLSEKLVAIYGSSQWDAFREKKMREMPGAKDLTRIQVWELSIFSENCSRYP